MPPAHQNDGKMLWMYYWMYGNYLAIHGCLRADLGFHYFITFCEAQTTNHDGGRFGVVSSKSGHYRAVRITEYLRSHRSDAVLIQHQLFQGRIDFQRISKDLPKTQP